MEWLTRVRRKRRFRPPRRSTPWASSEQGAHHERAYTTRDPVTAAGSARGPPAELPGDGLAQAEHSTDRQAAAGGDRSLRASRRQAAATVTAPSATVTAAAGRNRRPRRVDHAGQPARPALPGGGVQDDGAERRRRGVIVGMVGTRFAGLDGVSLEADKLATILQEDGHQVVWFASELGDRFRPGTTHPPAHFTHPANRALQPELFGTHPPTRPRFGPCGSAPASCVSRLAGSCASTRSRSPSSRTRSPAGQRPAGRGAGRGPGRNRPAAIGHHHDFAWERERFRHPSSPACCTRCFPRPAGAVAPGDQHHRRAAPAPPSRDRGCRAAQRGRRDREAQQPRAGRPSGPCPAARPPGGGGPAKIASSAPWPTREG
jgi:hypothetical protein